MKELPLTFKSTVCLFIVVASGLWTRSAVGQYGTSVRLSDQSTAQIGISPEVRRRAAFLKPRIEQVLRIYFQQRENSQDRSPWGVMHAMVAFGPYAEMYGDGKLVKDVDWLCQNGKCRGMQLMKLDKTGNLETVNGPGRQGHEGQFLAILAQSQIPKSTTLYVENRQFTIEDLVAYEMATCKPDTELTFKLIGLSHYLDSDTRWRARDGSIWNLERIIKEELKQPINGVACGGTHRLMGYSYAVMMRQLQNKPLVGQWKRADQFVSDFRDYAFSLQNRDGSFSTKWFNGREAKKDIQRRVQTSGHILEWLIFSATDQQIASPRVLRAVDYLSNLMLQERTTKWEIGPKGHAVRAIRLFYERVLTERAPLVQSGPQPSNTPTTRPIPKRTTPVTDSDVTATVSDSTARQANTLPSIDVEPPTEKVQKVAAKPIQNNVKPVMTGSESDSQPGLLISPLVTEPESEPAAKSSDSDQPIRREELTPSLDSAITKPLSNSMNRRGSLIKAVKKPGEESKSSSPRRSSSSLGQVRGKSLENAFMNQQQKSTKETNQVLELRIPRTSEQVRSAKVASESDLGIDEVMTLEGELQDPITERVAGRPTVNGNIK